MGLCGDDFGGAAWRFTALYPIFCAGSLAAVMARYLSSISSSSSMTSGSSTSVMSSGTVFTATGGAISPATVGGPTFAFPFSTLVGGGPTFGKRGGPMFAFPFSTLVGGGNGGHVYICHAYICNGSLREDWAVSSSTWTPLGCTSFPLRSITTGGRDG